MIAFGQIVTFEFLRLRLRMTILPLKNMLSYGVISLVTGAYTDAFG
jgi:hypothetical protein